MEGSWDSNKKQRLKVSCRDQPASNCFPGSRSMLNFGAFNGMTHSFGLEEIGNDHLDEYLIRPEKKRRLSIDQVKSLEKSFVKDNRLELESKIQLAKELNLEPRQIEIWFQNRRARSRTKQLEADYETLHESYVNLKNEYDNLVKENIKLKSEMQILCLKHDDSASDVDRSSSNFQLPMPEEAISGMILVEDEIGSKELAVAKSDVTTEIKVPLAFNEIQYFHLESDDSSRVFELDQSHVSQNGDDEFQLEPFHNFSKCEDDYCHSSSDYSFYYDLQVEDRLQASNFWSY